MTLLGNELKGRTKNILISFFIACPLFANAELLTSSTKHIYWVGHSLITSIDPYYDQSAPLPDVLKALALSQGHSIDGTVHAQPGAPLQANWGQAPEIWPDGYSQLPPLIDPKHPRFGAYNTMVLTEGIDLKSTMKAWNSAFYARRFYCAAVNANPDTKLYLYESWHHYQASDDNFRRQYGSIDRWDFATYNARASLGWTRIALDASKRGKAKHWGYRWQGTTPDPGDCDATLDIKIIPVGPALVALLERLRNPKADDDLSYSDGANGSHLIAEDLFANPHLDFPHNTKLHHNGDADDVHPSHILIYLSATVHYAVLFESSPLHLPATHGVPEGIARVIQDVAWQVVTNDPRTKLPTDESNHSNVSDTSRNRG